MKKIISAVLVSVIVVLGLGAAPAQADSSKVNHINYVSQMHKKMPMLKAVPNYKLIKLGDKICRVRSKGATYQDIYATAGKDRLVQKLLRVAVPSAVFWICSRD